MLKRHIRTRCLLLMLQKIATCDRSIWSTIGDRPLSYAKASRTRACAVGFARAQSLHGLATRYLATRFVTRCAVLGTSINLCSQQLCDYCLSVKIYLFRRLLCCPSRDLQPVLYLIHPLLGAARGVLQVICSVRLESFTKQCYYHSTSTSTNSPCEQRIS